MFGKPREVAPQHSDAVVLFFPSKGSTTPALTVLHTHQFTFSGACQHTHTQKHAGCCEFESFCEFTKCKNFHEGVSELPHW